MKFTIDLDITPEELRRVMGLPDVHELHSDMLAKFKDQMEAGAEGYDPLSLLKPYLQSNPNGLETLQKSLMAMMSQGFSANKKKTD